MPVNSSTPAQQNEQQRQLLQTGCHANTQHVGPAHDHGARDADDDEAHVYRCAEHLPQCAHADLRYQILDRGGQGDGLEQADVDVGKRQRPGAGETGSITQPFGGVNMFTPRPGHGGGEFGVGQTDEDDGQPPGAEGDEGADGTGSTDPVAGEEHPAPADHGAKGQREDVPASEHAGEGLWLFWHRKSWGFCGEGTPVFELR